MKTNYYKYFSPFLIVVGIVSIVLNTGNTQAQKVQEQSLLSPSKNLNYSRSRHTITLALNSLDELKVREGQRISEGDIISDRQSARNNLLVKKERIESSIRKVSLPINQLRSIPVPSYRSELIQLKQAQFNLNAIVKQVNEFDKNFHHKDPYHVQIFESDKITKLANLKRSELEASMNVENAIANLDRAKLNYQKQQYEHSLKVGSYQTALQKQQEQINSLQIQLDKVDDELNNLVSVSSPYRGRVRKIKILGQSDRSINVEVTLDVRRNGK